MKLEFLSRLDAPLACTASSDEIADQSETIRALRDEASEVTRLADGVRLRFAPDASRRDRIVGWIERESQCCGFLSFHLDQAADGALSLEITGGEVADAWIETVLER